MKRILVIAAAALLFAALPQNVSAQDPQQPERENYQQRRGRGQREQMTPEQMATRTTDRLNEVVGLNEKQYKKIYNFHLELIDEYPELRGNGFGGPGMGGQRPDGEMRRPGNGGPGMGPGGNRGDGPRRERPQMTEEQRAEMQARMQERMEERRALEQERQERIEKKYKKILTAEQYEKWQKWEAEEAVKREMRMKEQRERRQDGEHRHDGDRLRRGDRNDTGDGDTR
ncbi:MAG: hypothetical protein J5495_00115 [Bacteroidales bacterium]|nr:hypothetical protein [Bacteroidales bacterium]